MPNDERAKQLLEEIRVVDAAIDAAANERKLQLATGENTTIIAGKLAELKQRRDKIKAQLAACILAK